MRNQSIAVGLLLVLAVAALSCEIDTKLSIQGGNPPKFVISGNGSVRTIRVIGPKKQREKEGPDASAYWYIKSEKGGAKDADAIGSIIYGEVPEGYGQVYPGTGAAVPLVEGEKYYIRVDTANANGAEKYFIIRDGKVRFADYASGLDEN